MRLNYSIIQVMIFLILSLGFQLEGKRTVHNIRKFGAIPQRADSSKALNAAWQKACSTSGKNVILIPKGTYLLRPVTFIGPCKGKIVIQLRGILKAYSDGLSTFQEHWIAFQYIENFEIGGGGSLDGQGHSAWSKNDCTKNPKCRPLPTSLRLDYIHNGRVHNISSINSKKVHINVFECNNIDFDQVTIKAPDQSPNTDGFHIAVSRKIRIMNSDIGTGDDCIAMGPGTKFVSITNVHCGPGHGISIGSLGGLPNEDAISDIEVRSCTLTGTQNGVRIKTWSPSYPGLVTRIKYQDIHMVDVLNPVIIDQDYCPTGNCGQKGHSRVQIKDVKFERIWGNSVTKAAINLQCSKVVPCQGVELKDIQLPYRGKDGPAISLCSNVNGVSPGMGYPKPCIG